MSRERPVLFSGPMVRAILDGRKTVTRRVVVPANSDVQAKWGWLDFDAAWPDMLWGVVHGLKVPTSKAPPDYCPECVVRLYSRIEAGDLLWVRETWRYADWDEDGLPYVAYQADGATLFRDAIPEDWAERLTDVWAELSQSDNYAIDNRAADRRWRPSIHMPRWASRLTLRVTDVRVERLQEITEDDARAEGVAPKPNHLAVSFPPHVAGFCDLWDSLNADRGYGWASNPWVWRIAFDVVRPTAPHPRRPNEPSGHPRHPPRGAGGMSREDEPPR